MKHFTKHLLVLALAVGGVISAWAEDGDVTVTIGYKDIPDGFTATTGTSGSLTKTVKETNDLTIAYSGINTKSSTNATDHAYGYAMFLKNYGYVYNSVAPAGYYPSQVKVTFGSNTGTSGKVGITFGTSVLNTRNSSVSGTVTKGGTCTLTNTDKSKLYWNFSTTSANVQVDNIEVIYSIKTQEGYVAEPAISTSSGTYNEEKSVTITCETKGATIYYTTDGSTPTTSSAVYSEAITVNTTGTTIKAFAVKDGMTNSDVVSATYTLVPTTPEITNSGSKVTISSTGSTIYYTTDGSEPSDANGTLYSGPFDLETSPTTVKAIAYGFGSSSEIESKVGITFISGTVVWSEDFSSYSAGDVPTSGENAIYSMLSGGTSSTTIYAANLASGESPELLIAKSNGSMTATIGLRRYYGNMTLRFKTNNTNFSVSSTTTGVTCEDPTSDGNVRTVAISGIAENTKNLVLVISNGNSSNVRIDDFELYATSRSNPSVTITEAGYATYYCDEALDFTNTGLKAYIASVDGDAVTFTEVSKVPANTAVLLKGTANTYNIPTTAENIAAVSNKLTGVYVDTPTAAGIFVLMNGTSGVGFYKTTNAFTVGANTAYLPASAATAKVRFIGLDGEEIADDIEAIEATEGVNNGAIYNLAGQRVTAPTKGIYIKNGKKFIIK